MRNSTITKRMSDLKTIIIFDWDDTIMCTSVIELLSTNQSAIREKDLLFIKECEVAAYALLSEAIECGLVFIVTNASYAWIEYSCNHYMPSLMNLLKEVQVICCRDLYFSFYPNEEDKWKLFAFQSILLDDSYSQIEGLSVISIGDSHKERNALLTICNLVKTVIPKSIKMMDRPSAALLCRQQKFILNNLSTIIGCSNKLDHQLSFSM